MKLIDLTEVQIMTLKRVMCEAAMNYSREIGLEDLRVTDSHGIYRAIEGAIRQEVGSAQFNKDMSDAINRNTTFANSSVHQLVNRKH